MQNKIDIVYTTNYHDMEIVFNGKYRNYEYMICCNGNNPTAYIRIPNKETPFRSVVETAMIYFTSPLTVVNHNAMVALGMLNRAISVHGGITYIGDNLLDRSGLWIGWDYIHHPQDYSGVMRSGKHRWTTEEIINEVSNVINQIINIQK